MWHVAGVVSRPRTRTGRLLAVVALLCLIGAALVVVLDRRHDQRSQSALGPGVIGGVDAAHPFAYDAARRADYERHAARGLSHVLYAKSPGGGVASARRTARWRTLVASVARRHRLDPDMLEAIVFLESAGRADARASGDLHAAAGLTQILAETGQNLLGMRIDVATSERLTRGILRGHRVRKREALRRRVDERFDPEKALEATARYLEFARAKVGRDDLAYVAYHMGVGNLQQALAAYGKGTVPYAQLYFDSSPLRHGAAWRKLAALGDDSSTYLWRLLAARDIMRLYRRNPSALRREALLQSRKASSEEVLHPAGSTAVYKDPAAIRRARASGALRVLDGPALLKSYGLRIDPRMGELARRVHQPAALYRALRPQALAVLEVLGGATRAISHSAPLTVTSTVRDVRYQRMLAADDIEATHNYSLHTTGFAFDIARAYRSRAQALAFQFVLDRLTALGLIAWVREPEAIHVTVASR
jgi:Transglycosylase SLT domain